MEEGAECRIYRDMFAIGDILTGGTTPQSYWLGRKALWRMLCKSVPSEYGAAQQLYYWKYALLDLGAEAITPYVDNLNPEMFASVRHDTFLMLQDTRGSFMQRSSRNIIRNILAL